LAVEIVSDTASGRKGTADIVVVGPTCVILFSTAVEDSVYTAPPDTVNKYCWLADVVIVTVCETTREFPETETVIVPFEFAPTFRVALRVYVPIVGLGLINDAVSPETGNVYGRPASRSGSEAGPSALETPKRVAYALK
jgi:hypothetical protein